MRLNKVIGIAINEYEDAELNRLNNCLNDLNEIVSVLESKYHFDEIELLVGKEQTTRKYLFNKLQNYFLDCLEDENVLLIYAGHGEYNNHLQTAYWLPSNSDSKDASTWFNLNELVVLLKATKAFHVSIVSDSCFSGAIFEAPTRGGGVQALHNKKSRLALTSGGIEKVSDGVKDQLSPFAKELCIQLRDNQENELPFSVLASRLILSFADDKKQTPMFGSLFNCAVSSASI